MESAHSNAYGACKAENHQHINRQIIYVKNINLVKPTIKRYLAGFTKSQFRRIDADEFVVATLLPVQKFKKASADTVWSESRKMI